MEQDEVVLEDGELSNDSDQYTPLERPTNYSRSQPMPRLPVDNTTESEDNSNSSSSDSDSSFKRNKRARIKIKPRARLQNSNRKKYDIWSSRLREDGLSETLNNCDVTQKDRSREVESYDYTLAYKFHNEEKSPFCNNKNNKRTFDDRNDINFKQRKRSPGSKKMKGSKRVILALKTDVNSDTEVLAKDIANKLYEEKEDLIKKVIVSLGKQRAIDIFEETRRIEEEGGMLIMNQTRRTPGGVYLFLVRHDYHITPDQKTEIFGEERQRNKKMIKEKQKEKTQKLKHEIAASRTKILPDLLTRAELLASQNPSRKVKETDESDFVNPPPTPETDGHENSGDDMDEHPSPIINAGSNTLENSRGKLNTYDDDFLDIGCTVDMDMF
ncbi:phosphorylated adaptor for RNA export [Leptinotarsa decemlineata]|uniref:phosphorylated adaptor for RNA export n=1 Tax=Leptinotarsa decemlineata TaxID=7539 RepID=UPI003D30CFEF